MKVTCVEGVANHDSPESCVVVGNRRGEALAGGGAGLVDKWATKPLPKWQSKQPLSTLSG